MDGIPETASRLVQGAEQTDGFGTGGLGGQAALDELLRAQLDVQRDLVIHVRRHTLRTARTQPEEAPDAGANPVGLRGVRRALH
jgi:hypothetical protein